MNKFIFGSLLLHILVFGFLFLDKHIDSNTDNNLVEFTYSDTENNQNKGNSKEGQLEKTESFGVKKETIIPVSESISSKSNSSYFYGVGAKFQEQPVYLTIEGNRFLTLKIEEIFQDYAGYKAGLRSGDYIVKVNGSKVTNQSLIFSQPQNIQLLILRNNQLLTLNLTLSKVFVSSNGI